MGKYLNPMEPFAERWMPACQAAFECIKEKLTSPVLGFANPKLPYVLHTDTSSTGLGVLYTRSRMGECG